MSTAEPMLLTYKYRLNPTRAQHRAGLPVVGRGHPSRRGGNGRINAGDHENVIALAYPGEMSYI